LISDDKAIGLRIPF